MIRQSQTYNILSILLSYPNQETIDNLDLMREELTKENLLGKKALKQLTDLMTWMGKTDILDIEEHYVDRFERTSSLSLYLFEHIHGDSRQRGQAMVDLTNYYRQHGLSTLPSELPDYLPIFLEFLSFMPKKDAKNHLGEVINILQVLLERLTNQASPYAAVLFALKSLTPSLPNFSLIQEIISKDKGSLPSNEILDGLWEDKPVTFMGNSLAKTCSDCSSTCTPKSAAKPISMGSGKGERP